MIADWFSTGHFFIRANIEILGILKILEIQLLVFKRLPWVSASYQNSSQIWIRNSCHSPLYTCPQNKSDWCIHLITFLPHRVTTSHDHIKNFLYKYKAKVLNHVFNWHQNPIPRLWFPLYSKVHCPFLSRTHPGKPSCHRVPSSHSTMLWKPPPIGSVSQCHAHLYW